MIAQVLSRRRSDVPACEMYTNMAIEVDVFGNVNSTQWDAG